jgi:ABC-2 type transport system permease protein
LKRKNWSNISSGWLEGKEGLRMQNLTEMIWIEMRKAIRSRMPIWTALASLFMPLGMGILIFASKNPVISHKLGLISVKADLVAYAATDWSSYIDLTSLVIAAGGFFFFILVVSWVFGREFVDGTLKDLLAVPIQRSSIILAKFIVIAIWSWMLTLVILVFSLMMGTFINLPGFSKEVIINGSIHLVATALLVMVVSTPFALIASIGRGYLLPLGVAVLMLMGTNIMAVAGWGETFPWAVPGLFAQGKTILPPLSYMIVFITGLLGIVATYFWWKYADQNR